MNKIFFTLIAFLALNFSVQASTDITGEWLGTRYQYDATKSKYIAEFEYKYNLVQDENQVKGTAFIKSKGGNFAEINIRGFVEGDKFYFEEYEITNATRSENMIWCIKKGVLNISIENGKVNLHGATPSFMEIYGYECSGGFTQLSKDNIIITDEKIQEIANKDANLNLTVYPNPYVETTTLSFDNPITQPVLIDVVDIQGKVIDVLENKVLDKGNYQLNYTPKQNTNALYFYIRVKLGDKLYTRAIQKSPNSIEYK